MQGDELLCRPTWLDLYLPHPCSPPLPRKVPLLIKVPFQARKFQGEDYRVTKREAISGTTVYEAHLQPTCSTHAGVAGEQYPGAGTALTLCAPLQA